MNQIQILLLFYAVIYSASATFAIKREILEESADESFIAQLFGKEDEDDYKSICGDESYDDDNLETICKFYGYEGYGQVTELSSYTLNDSYSLGFKSIDCEDARNTESCEYTTFSEDSPSCTTLLVVNCTEKWSSTPASTNDLILPILLCIATVFLVITMIVMSIIEKKRVLKARISMRNSQKERWAANRVISVLTESAANSNKTKPSHHEATKPHHEPKAEVEEVKKYNV